MTGLSVRAAMRLAGLIVCGMLAAGCEAHLYNQENDKQAALLKEKIAAVKFDDTFKTARENQKSLSDALIESDLKASQLNAKFKLLAIIARKDDVATKGLPTQIRSQWNGLAGNVPPTTADLDRTIYAGLATYSQNSDAARRLRLISLAFAGMGGRNKLPDCENKLNALGQVVLAGGKPVPDLPTADDVLKGSLPRLKDSLTGQYQSYVDACVVFLEQRRTLESLFEGQGKGSTGQALSRWRGQIAIYNAARDSVAALKKNYDTSNEEYQKALQDIKNKQPNAEEKAKKALKKAGDALEKLADIQNNKIAEDIGLKVLSEERITKIEEILGTLDGTKSTSGDPTKIDDDVKDKLAAIAGLPKMIDTVGELYANAKKTRLTPLKLELAYQQQVLTAAQRNLDHQKNEIEFRRQVYLNHVQMAQESLLAQIELSRLSNASLLNQPLYKTIKDEKTSDEDRGAITKTLIHYYRAEVKYGSMIQKAPLEAASRVYQRNIDADETSMAEWKTLMEGEAALLSQYHAAGIKPEAWGQLAALAALIWIGAGVN